MRGEPSRLGKPSTHRVESYSIVPVDGNCGLVTCSVGNASALINGRLYLSLLNSFYSRSQISLESRCRDAAVFDYRSCPLDRPGRLRGVWTVWQELKVSSCGRSYAE